MRNVVESLRQRRVRFVLWSLYSDLLRNGPEKDHLAPFRAYLRENYRVVKAFENGDQLWQINP